MQPTVFIGSSLEATAIGHTVQSEFAHDYTVALWNKNVFRPGEGFLDSLLNTAAKCDFGIFVFAPDDLVTSRGTNELCVRDNVLFECGIFLGRLGRGRSFFLVPRGHVPLHLPTDLSGVSPAHYDDAQGDEERRNAVRVACAEIKERMEEEMHLHEPVSLNGTWVQTWSVEGTDYFSGDNRGRAEVLHIGSDFTASCHDPLHPFNAHGSVERGFITGSWGSTSAAVGYFGSFQLRVSPRGDKLEGHLVGFRSTGETATGPWHWKREG